MIPINYNWIDVLIDVEKPRAKVMASHFEGLFLMPTNIYEVAHENRITILSNRL